MTSIRFCRTSFRKQQHRKYYLPGRKGILYFVSLIDYLPVTSLYFHELVEAFYSCNFIHQSKQTRPRLTHFIRVEIGCTHDSFESHIFGLVRSCRFFGLRSTCCHYTFQDCSCWKNVKGRGIIDRFQFCWFQTKYRLSNQHFFNMG